MTRLCRFISSGVPGARWHALKGFKRIHLEAGQKRTVQFTPGDRDLSSEDESGQRRIVAGDVQVWIGGGQPSGRLKAAGASTQFTLDPAAALPD